MRARLTMLIAGLVLSERTLQGAYWFIPGRNRCSQYSPGAAKFQ
jgi:hypothetical protein